MTLPATKHTRHVKRNGRVHLIDRDEWKRERNAYFRRNVQYAAAAKATRTALGVTQSEVAKRLDGGLSITAITNRESGKYTWAGGQEELVRYQRLCARIAGI